ncbi:MAG TPA: polysaccharide biosynthesis protein [Cytophagales bacterium]|nr:polysaccharide biosynthesis protein [Cytophagales bacterium]HAA18990.1 polysaccharide biosynthesis protein [Cytophagales bacterium]HAP61833.1 polysaccharide biosynthesis protein [Cytophagales bacterium]
MANPLRRLLGETALYGLSSVLGRVLNFLLVPLYTQVLPADGYGIVTDLYAWVAFLLVVYTFGMETSFFRHATKNPEHAERYYRASTTAIFITSLTLSLLLVGLATPIVGYLQYPGKEVFVYWLVGILFIDAFSAIPFAQLRLQHKAKPFAIIKLFGIALNIGLNLFFILLCPAVHAGEAVPFLSPLVEWVYKPTWDVEYIFLSNLVANGVMLLLLVPTLRTFRPEFQWKFLRPMLVYAYPLLFMGIAGVTNEMMSRAFLKQLMPEGFYAGRTNQESLGIFGACYKLAVFMNLAVQAFRYAAEPFFFGRAKDKNSPQLFAQVMHGFILLGALMLVGITVNLEWLGPLMLRRPEYLEALHIVPTLLLANLLLGVYFNLSVWFKLTDRTYFGTGIALGGALLTVVFNLMLIPTWGYEGAALTTVLVYAVMTIANFWLGQKHYPIPYHTNKGLLYLFLSTVIAFGFRYYLLPTGTIVSLVVGNLLLLSLLLVMLRFERRLFKTLT